MIKIPYSWSFRRRSMLTIIEAKCECMEVGIENILIKEAVGMIEKAAEFKEQAYPNKPDFQSTSKLTISFSLIFSSESDIKNFMESLNPK